MLFKWAQSRDTKRQIDLRRGHASIAPSSVAQSSTSPAALRYLERLSGHMSNSEVEQMWGEAHYGEWRRGHERPLSWRTTEFIYL